MKKPFPALLLFTLFAMTFVAACTTTPENADRHIYIVRHAEKCTLPADDPPLTPAGRQRSEDLVLALSNEQIGAVYSTPYARTLQTVTPIAEARGLEIVRTPVSSGFIGALADTLRASQENGILVSGHSNTVPGLVNALVGTEYENLDESIYDLLYVVTMPTSGTPSVQVRTYGGPSMGVVECMN